MIAHRLSTIKKADRIVVLKDGAMIEHGTHQSLLVDRNSVYYNLVNAQHLDIATGDDDQAAEKGMPEETGFAPEDLQIDTASEDFEETDAPVYKPKGLIASVGFFLYEQRRHYLLYLVIFFGAMVAGGRFSCIIISRLADNNSCFPSAKLRLREDHCCVPRYRAGAYRCRKFLGVDVFCHRSLRRSCLYFYWVWPEPHGDRK